MITIRDAMISDAARILEIYDYYVRNTAITFEYETPSIAEFEGRMKNTMKRYPYLVILKDGHIEGYAYAGAFVGRAAYDWSCETTVYLDHNAQKCGLGRKIYEALENALRKMGILNLYACIANPEKEDEYLTMNSADFHAHFIYGFSSDIYHFFRCVHTDLYRSTCYFIAHAHIPILLFIRFRVNKKQDMCPVLGAY